MTLHAAAALVFRSTFHTISIIFHSPFVASMRVHNLGAACSKIAAISQAEKELLKK